MVIEACENTVYVSGVLHTNHWSAIKNMVDLISASCPCGVWVDFGNVIFFSELGERTVSEALCDIENRDFPITLINLPPQVKTRIESFSSGCRAEHDPSDETRRIHAAIYSERWWQRLWGAVA